MKRLSHQDHRRDIEGLTYVYPVLSRRSGGLSIGINLSPNNACNYACLYCQVPNLKRGSSPAADIEQLILELETLLERHALGAFQSQYGLEPEEARIRDLAISGNGEPTSCPNLVEVIHALGEVLERASLPHPIKKVLITNGSLTHLPRVLEALKAWGAMGGEVWFKLDRASSAGIRALNQAHASMDQVRRNLSHCLEYAPTWIQTCLVNLDGNPQDSREWTSYLQLIEDSKNLSPNMKGVHFYGLARPSLQQDAKRVSPLSETLAKSYMRDIERLGLSATFHP